MILQTYFDGLLRPQFFTQELAILLAIIFFSYLYIAMRLRSLFGIFGWALTLITFILTFVTPVQFFWFWIMVIAEAFILVLAMLEYTRAYARAKN